jgi:hypothetical protein
VSALFDDRHQRAIVISMGPLPGLSSLVIDEVVNTSGVVHLRARTTTPEAV